MNARGVLITGGAGYVGAPVARALAAAGRRVVVLDDLSTGRREALRWGEFVEGDAGDAELVRRTCVHHDVDAVLHFAGRISVEESVRDPGGYREANVEVTRRLADAAAGAGVERFVFSSSAAVYGTPRGATGRPIPEDHPLAPDSPYGETKLLAERLLASSPLAVASLRYFNAAGAVPSAGLGERHEPETHLVPLLLRAVASGEAFRLFGTDWPTPDGTCVRDYIHVEDLASAHVAALSWLERPTAGAPPQRGVFNLGTGRGHSVREVVDAVERVTARRVRQVDAPRRAGDAAYLVADPSRAARDLAWRTTGLSSLERIVTDAWAFHRQSTAAT